MRNKLLITGIIGILFLAVLMSTVSAHSWACLRYGESIPHFTCHHDTCKLCLDDKGYSTNFGYCNDKPACTFGPAINDTDPPVINLFSPINDYVFKERTVLFNLTSDEPVSLSYLDNINGQGRWSNLASKRLFYIKKLSFKDGLIDITIKAEDRYENYVNINRIFYVDTKKPKVNTPKYNEDGTLTINFDEANPVSLKLKIGNNKTGYGSFDIDLNKCNIIKTKYICIYNITKEIDDSFLIPYNDQEVEVWIELTDIAGNIGKSKIRKSIVDIDAPIINNPDTFYKIDGRYFVFNMSISEKHFEGVYYYENFGEIKKICSSLSKGLCKKKIAFSKGNHDVIVIVIDESGNFIIKEIEFTIN